jgi:hypothetical protein
MTMHQALERISVGLVSFARELGENLESRVQRGRTVVEWSTSDRFPLTVFLTVSSLEGQDSDDLVFEITFREAPDAVVVATELMSESGEVVAPTIISHYAWEDLAAERDDAWWQIRRDIRKYVESYVDVLQDRFGAPERDDAGRRAGLAHEDILVEPLIVDQATLQRLLRDEFATELLPAEVRLRGDKVASFDFVSDDSRIVGELKTSRSASESLESLTAAIWRLQQVPDAERRFIVLAPEAGRAARWLSLYGMDALGGIELWAVKEDGPLSLSRVC